MQRRRLHGARGARAPHVYKWLGTGGGTVSRTANNKLAKLYWPSRKRSPKRLIVLLEQKKCRGTTKKIVFRRLAPNRCPLSLPSGAPPHFQIRSAATVCVRHCCAVFTNFRCHRTSACNSVTAGADCFFFDHLVYARSSRSKSATLHGNCRRSRR